MNKVDAVIVLKAFDLVYGNDEDMPNGDMILNMNDVWGWATAWGEEIPPDQLQEVMRLIERYGYCGALYWVSKRHDDMRSEFEDINRFVDFVRHEESILKEEPDSNRRAYLKRSYTL